MSSSYVTRTVSTQSREAHTPLYEGGLVLALPPLYPAIVELTPGTDSIVSLGFQKHPIPRCAFFSARRAVEVTGAAAEAAAAAVPRLLHVVPVRGHVQDARPPLNAAATTGKYIDNTTNIVTTVVAQSHVCVVTCSRWADAIMVVAFCVGAVSAVCRVPRAARRRVPCRMPMPDARRHPDIFI